MGDTAKKEKRTSGLPIDPWPMWPHRPESITDLIVRLITQGYLITSEQPLVSVKPAATMPLALLVDTVSVAIKPSRVERPIRKKRRSGSSGRRGSR